VTELRTAAAWNDHRMLGWFDAMGFALAPVQVLELSVEGGAFHPEREDALSLEPGHGPGGEIDFGASAANDFERLGRERAHVRSMTRADVAEIARIDRGTTGRERGDYIASRFAEAIDDAGVRVSLVAQMDGAVVGYLMARADLGDFGRTEPVALIDTLGVEPEYAERGVGRALATQLFANLVALRVERVETVVGAMDLELLGFFASLGFAPSQRLAFVRRLTEIGA
jgi:predicted N-acetyltransferase YhbS